MAVGAGDATVAFETADEISRLYEVNALDMKAAAFGKMLKATKTPQQRAPVVEQGCALLEEAANKDKLELARQLGQQLAAEARRVHDAELVKSVNAVRKRINEQAAAYRRYQEAQDVLKVKPEDHAANLAVGNYFCLTKGQWTEGLPYLLKSGDKDLQRVAAMETPTPPATGDNQVKLADAWWDLAHSRHSPQREQVLVHAGSWYEKAAATVTASLVKSRIYKRLGEIAGIEAATSSGTAPPAAVAPFGDKTAVLHQKALVQALARAGGEDELDRHETRAHSAG